MSGKWNAWVWIKWRAGTPSNAWETWQKNPSIKNAWSTMGEWDCCLWVDVQSPAELEEFVWKNIRKNEWVQATNTTWSKQWW
jgi:Lrp/AsnC ligand binding domain